jgi:hypothetical protein
MGMNPLANLFWIIIDPISRPNELSKVIRDLLKGHVPLLEIPAFVIWLLLAQKREETLQ